MIRRAAAMLLAMAALSGGLLDKPRKESAPAAVAYVPDAGCSMFDVDYLPEREATAEEIEHGDMVGAILRKNAPDARLYMLRCLYDGIGEDEVHCVAHAIYDAVYVYDADVVNISSLWYLQNEAVFACTDGRCGDRNGSSFAEPRVCAWISNQFTAAEKTTDAQIRERLKAAAIDAGDEGYDIVFGWGCIDIKK